MAIFTLTNDYRMNRRQSVSLLSSLLLSFSLKKSFAEDIKNQTKALTYTAYLMAYFMENDQKLYYAYSRNAQDWTALNKRRFVLDAKVDLRDPFIARAKNKFHLVHTHGWDHNDIFHWQSDDLTNWHGGAIQVVSDDKKRAWAPEFVYEETEGLFYVFWASVVNGHNAIHYVTTKDWTDITFERSSVYYDLGIHDIDFTITHHNGAYYAFHKPGSLADNMGIALMTSPTLNPLKKEFGFGKNGRGREPLTGDVRPIEGPEVIKLINEDRWYVYADPFYNNFMAWETTDFIHFTKIPVSAPRGSKHCSLLAITEEELNVLLQKYPV